MPTGPADDASPSAVAPGRTLIMIHGGGHKPQPDELSRLWEEAIAAGLDRDFPDDGGRSLLGNARLELVYYGDLSNAVIAAAGQAPDPALDLADRRRDLQRLSRLSSSKKFRRVHYEGLPGKSAAREFLADVAAPLLGALGVGEAIVERRLPALGRYLSGADGLREACEHRLLECLRPALARGDDVLLLSHAMGSVIGYDVLWRLSHDPDVASRELARVRTWITFGSPLASEYVKRRLRGAGKPQAHRYPDRVVTWLNVAAEDDFHCHDKTMANDYEALLKLRLASRLRDYRIYNLAMRYGRSNPHSALGYLVHPRVSRLLADWLLDRPED